MNRWDIRFTMWKIKKACPSFVKTAVHGRVEALFILLAIGFFLRVAAMTLNSVALPSHAAGEESGSAGQSRVPGQEEINVNQADETPNMDKWKERSLLSGLGGLNSSLVGNPERKTKGKDGAYIPDSGAVGQVGVVMAKMIEHPPASSQEYIADLLQHSPLVPQAYAQGYGFKSMTNILPIWKVFLNLTYIGYILAFVVLGFMIMFRQKLGGQIVTFTSALPHLVITLLLITFSYAIAGFVIDLMYLSIYLIVGIAKGLINDVTYFGTPIPLSQVALSSNIFLNGMQLVFSNIRPPGEDPATVVGTAASSVSSLVESFFVNNNLAVEIAGLTSGVLAALIFAVAIFFAVVKTFFELLKSYVAFILGVIFAPVLLFLGALSGNNNEFMNWFKGLIQALVPFPIVVGMIFLAILFAGGAKDKNVGYHGDKDGGFVPPQIRLFTDQSGGQDNAVQGLIAFGIVMLIPEAVEIAKKAIKAKSFLEQFAPDIAKNLKKGWEGGEVVSGLGIKAPGMKNIVPGLAKGTAKSILSGGAGTLAGAGLGYYQNRGGSFADKVKGTMVGGALGGVGGTVAPVVIQYGPKVMDRINKTAKGARDTLYTAESVGTLITGGGYKKSGPIEKANRAKVEQAQSTVHTPANNSDTDTGD
jgi:hypothetical protein